MLLAGFAVGVGELTTDGKPTTECAVLARDVARPLGRRWVERLARSSAPFPADAPPDALDRIRALAQFATASG
jgi:queuine tRNA-ribosyltransferase